MNVSRIGYGGDSRATTSSIRRTEVLGVSDHRLCSSMYRRISCRSVHGIVTHLTLIKIRDLYLVDWFYNS